MLPDPGNQPEKAFLRNKAKEAGPLSAEKNAERTQTRPGRCETVQAENPHVRNQSQSSLKTGSTAHGLCLLPTR
jgi:hypothetical protein